MSRFLDVLYSVYVAGGSALLASAGAMIPPVAATPADVADER